MNDQRDEDRDDRVQRRERDDRRMNRRDEIDRHAPRGRYSDDEDDEPYGRSDPRRKANGPGLALVIVGWIGLLLSLALAGFGLALPYLNLVPPPPPILAGVYVGLGVLLAAANVLIILGGSRMRRCRSWGLALTAAILCIASFLLFGPCGVVNVAFGIWAMVVLLNADVKREFERVAGSGGRATEGR